MKNKELAVQYANEEYPVITDYSSFEKLASEMRNNIAYKSFLAGLESANKSKEKK